MAFKLSNLFFTEDENSKTDVKKVEKNEPKNENFKSPLPEQTMKFSQEYQTQVNTNTSQGGPASNEIAEKARQTLLKAMEDNNIPGYDYFEFRASLRAMESVIPDEQMRYKSAYAAVSTLGVNPQRLVDTAGHYINVLKNEEQKFLAALSSKNDSDIIGSTKQLEQIDIEIKKRNDDIARLQDEIRKLQNSKTDIATRINEAKGKIENSKNGFYISLNDIIGSITADINKINKYLR